MQDNTNDAKTLAMLSYLSQYSEKMLERVVFYCILGGKLLCFCYAYVLAGGLALC